MPEKEKSIGALWKKEGKTHLSGEIEVDGRKIRIVVFENSYRTTERHPDYKIYVAKERSL